MAMRQAFALFASISVTFALLPSAVSHATNPQAPTTPVAQGSWSMVPQSKDVNKDGFIDGDGGVPKSGAMSSNPSSTYVGAENFIAQPNERLIGGSLSWYLEDRKTRVL